MTIEKMLTETEVAAMLGLTVSAIRQKRIRKQPPFAKKIGHAVRYPESEVIAYLEAAPLAIKDEEILKPGRKRKVTPRPPAPPCASKIANRETEILEILRQAEKMKFLNWVFDPVGEMVEILGETNLWKGVGSEVANAALVLKNEECSPTFTPDFVTAEQVRAWARPYLSPEHAGLAAALWARYRILNPPLTPSEREILFKK